MMNISSTLCLFFIFFIPIHTMDLVSLPNDIHCNYASELSLPDVIQLSSIHSDMYALRDVLYSSCKDINNKIFVAENIPNIYGKYKNEYPLFIAQLKLLYAKYYFEEKHIIAIMNLGFTIKKTENIYTLYLQKKNKKYSLAFQRYTINYLKNFKKNYHHFNSKKTIFSVLDAHKRNNLLDYFDTKITFDISTLENFMIKAIRLHEYYILTELLKRPIDISKHPFIYMICEQDDPEMVLLTLQHKPELIKNFLTLAVNLGRAQIVTILLDNYIIENDVYIYNQIYKSIKNNNKKIVELFLTYKTYNKDEIDHLLICACKYAEPAILMDILGYYPDIYHIFPNGNTLLFYAIEGCNYNMVQFLLDNNLNVNTKNEYGITPFMLACQNYTILSYTKEKTFIIALLLEYGVDSLKKMKHVFPSAYKQYKINKKKFDL